MKEFDFLEKSRYFDCKKYNEIREIYYFREEEKSGRIWVPKGIDEIYWQFWASKSNFATHSSSWKWRKNDDTLPVWFRELVKEANVSLEKRDKIRKLFI